MSIIAAIDELIGVAKITTLPDKKNLWDELVNDCKEHNKTGFSMNSITEIEKIINLLLKSYKEYDLIEIYKECEVALLNKTSEEDYFDIKSISMDIEIELLERFTEFICNNT